MWSKALHEVLQYDSHAHTFHQHIATLTLCRASIFNSILSQAYLNLDKNEERLMRLPEARDSCDVGEKRGMRGLAISVHADVTCSPYIRVSDVKL